MLRFSGYIMDDRCVIKIKAMKLERREIEKEKRTRRGKRERKRDTKE